MSNLTVIIPCYNKESYIELCLNSLFCQTYKDFDIILLDDCSLDNSYKIARSFCDKYSNLLVAKNDINLGVSATRNAGARLAKTKYITFLDADDFYYEKDKLKNEMALIQKQPNDIAFSNVLKVRADEKFVVRRYCFPTSITGKKLRVRNTITYKTIQCRDYIVSKEKFFDAGGYKEGCSLFEDLDLLYKLSYSCNFYNTCQYGTAYRMTENGLSSKTEEELLTAECGISKTYIEKYGSIERYILLLLRGATLFFRRVIRRINN